MSSTVAEPATVLESWQGQSVRALAESWGIPELVAYASIGSTNDEARTRAAAGCPAGTVIIADEQTAGRGRSGSAWSAAPGSSLLLSIVLRPAVASGSAFIGALPLRAGLAVARAIDEVAAVRAGFKWPNDLLVDGRKLAGILCEGALDSAGGCVVCGVGVNVGQRAADFPEHLRGNAASLRTAGAPEVDGVSLAGAVVRALMHAGAGLSSLSKAELAALEEIDVLRGHAVAVDGKYVGTAAGIAPDGALRIRNGNDVRAVYSGTVRFQPQPQPQP